MKSIRKKALVVGALSFFILVSASYAKDKTEPVDYVNPYMGNISHLLFPTYPTVHLPNGMLRVYPERKDFTSDLCHGLPVAVTSHRGASAFNLSPVCGLNKEIPSVRDYSYDREKISPYHFTVSRPRCKELSARPERAGFKIVKRWPKKNLVFFPKKSS